MDEWMCYFKLYGDMIFCVPHYNFQEFGKSPAMKFLDTCFSSVTMNVAQMELFNLPEPRNWLSLKLRIPWWKRIMHPFKYRRWERVSSRIIEEEMRKNKDAIQKTMEDVLIYGQSFLKIDDEKVMIRMNPCIEVKAEGDVNDNKG